MDFGLPSFLAQGFIGFGITEVLFNLEEAQFGSGFFGLVHEEFEASEVSQDHVHLGQFLFKVGVGVSRFRFLGLGGG